MHVTEIALFVQCKFMRSSFSNNDSEFGWVRTDNEVNKLVNGTIKFLIFCENARYLIKWKMDSCNPTTLMQFRKLQLFKLEAWLQFLGAVWFSETRSMLHHSGLSVIVQYWFFKASNSSFQIDFLSSGRTIKLIFFYFDMRIFYFLRVPSVIRRSTADQKIWTVKSQDFNTPANQAEI